MLNNTFFRWFKDPSDVTKGFTDVFIHCDGTIFEQVSEPRYQASDLIKNTYDRAEQSPIYFVYETLPGEDVMPGNAIHMVGYSKDSDRKYIINWSDEFDTHLFRFEQFECSSSDFDEYYEEYEEHRLGDIGTLMIFAEHLETVFKHGHETMYCPNKFMEQFKKCSEKNHLNWTFEDGFDSNTYEDYTEVFTEEFRKMLDYDAYAWCPEPIDWDETIKLHPHATIDSTPSKCAFRYPDGVYEVEDGYKVHYNDNLNTKDDEAEIILATNEELRIAVYKAVDEIKNGSPTIISNDVADFMTEYLSEFINVYDDCNSIYWCTLKISETVERVVRGYMEYQQHDIAETSDFPQSLVLRMPIWVMNTCIGEDYHCLQLNDTHCAIFYNYNHFDWWLEKHPLTSKDVLNKALKYNGNYYLMPITKEMAKEW